MLRQNKYETIAEERKVNEEKENDSILNKSIDQSKFDGKTPSITSFVMIIMFVFVALVSPATILEMTQDIRETRDQHISHYMNFGLTLLTLFVIFVVQILSCKCGRGLTETATLSESIPIWKFCLYFAMGIPAIISFIHMCTVANDNKAELCMIISRLIFILVQYGFFLHLIIFKKNNCAAYLPKSLYLHYVQIAIAIASNAAICIDLIIEDDKEEPLNGVIEEYVYPFRFEFMLFSISMWLDLFPRYESEDNSSRFTGSHDYLKDLVQHKHPIMLLINFIFSFLYPILYVLPILVWWSSICSMYTNTNYNNSISSNTTNTTHDDMSYKTTVMSLNIIIFIIIILYEIFLLIRILLNPPNTTSAMHRYLKPSEILLIICASSFNVYHVAIIIPDIYFLANNSSDHSLYNFTVAEVIDSFIAIIYIFIQTALILKLARLELNNIGFNMISFVPLFYPALAINMLIWFLSCIEKQKDCIAWESSPNYKHYWHILQNSLFPVGIFFQWHSGELLIEIGSELKLFKIYQQIWSYFICCKRSNNFESI